MATVSVYNQAGESAGAMELQDGLFKVPVSIALLHEVVVAQGANTRVAIADTKTRGEVRGGGKKPWKQKGTGRARHGSIRSPIWRGGGITFGPTSLRNFAKKINRKARKKALGMALSDALANERFLVVDSLLLPEAKTRGLEFMLMKLPHADVRRTLVVVEEANTAVGVAANNLQNIDVIPVHCLNTIAVLKAQRIIISQDAVQRLQELFAIKN